MDKRFEINYRTSSPEEVGIQHSPQTRDTLIVLQGHPEEARDEILQKQPPGEVAADSDHYVIGLKMFFTFMFGGRRVYKDSACQDRRKISLPLVNEIRAGANSPAVERP